VYTFSKDITFQPGGVAGSLLTAQTILVPGYINYDRNVSSLDRTNSFVWSSSYELPFGKGRQMLQKGILSQVVGGWGLNGVFTHYSGIPYTVTSSATSCNCPGSSQTANQILKNVTQVGNGLGGQAYFNPLAYAPVTGAAFGTSGFDQLRGPGATNLDLNLFRDFRITERTKIQIRAEAFNLSNTPHFANPGANVSNLQLNSDGSVKNLNGFSVITATTPLGRLIDPRYFRFGMRFEF
jgi:hypothetical protein